MLSCLRIFGTLSVLIICLSISGALGVFCLVAMPETIRLKTVTGESTEGVVRAGKHFHKYPYEGEFRIKSTTVTPLAFLIGTIRAKDEQCYEISMDLFQYDAYGFFR